MQESICEKPIRTVVCFTDRYLMLALVGDWFGRAALDSRRAKPEIQSIAKPLARSLAIVQKI